MRNLDDSWSWKTYNLMLDMDAGRLRKILTLAFARPREGRRLSALRKILGRPTPRGNLYVSLLRKMAMTPNAHKERGPRIKLKDEP